jgi:transposase-like protein
VFCFRGKQKLYLYRAVDEHGQVIDVLLRNKRDRVSAEAFFRQALARTEVKLKAVITDHHQPYVKAVATVIPLARHIRTGLHRCRGYTTQHDLEGFTRNLSTRGVNHAGINAAVTWSQE